MTFPQCAPFNGYRQLLRTPGAWRFLLPGFAARQPYGMLTTSIVLLVQHTTGSYGRAGAAAAFTGVSMALFAPQSGKLADRFGQRAVLMPGVVIHAMSGAALAVVALAHEPPWALFAAAASTGASLPQIGPMVRARWAAILNGGTRGAGVTGRAGGGAAEGSALMPTAAAFESVTDELTFAVGPVLATALCTGVHAAAGLVAEAALTLVGGLLFAAQGRTPPPFRRPDGVKTGTERTCALSVPGVRALAVAFLGIGSVFGGMQVSLTAFTEQIGRPGLVGPLYGLLAAGNMLAGIAMGATTWRAGPRRRMLVGYTGLTVATCLLWTAHSVLLLGALGLVVGLCIAPAMITGYTLVESLVPPSSRTEAFTWLSGMIALGHAAAVTIAGQLADMRGADAGFLLPPAGTALALVTLVALRSRLVPRARSRTVARRTGPAVPLPTA